VAALPIDVVGEVELTTVNSATRGLVAGLQRGGLSVLGPQEISEQFPNDSDCSSASCLASLRGDEDSQSVGDSYVLRTTVEKVDADFQIKLELINPDDRVTVATVDAACEICGAQELAERISDAAASMQPRIESLRPKFAILEVDGAPLGATVYVDGELKGQTPITLEMSPGNHTLRVEKGDFVAQERNWSAAAGVRERISYDLAQAAKGGPHPAIGWTIFGLGLGAVGAGVPLLVLDERPYESNCDGLADVNGRCPDRYATKEAGIILAAAGGAALVAGIVTLVFSYRNRKASRIGAASS
jgi:hypothetical protein